MLHLPAVALESARKAADLQPRNPDILADYGAALFENRKLAESESVLRAALTLNPNDSIAHTMLAELLRVTNRLEEAGRHLSRATRPRRSWPGQ